MHFFSGNVLSASTFVQNGLQQTVFLQAAHRELKPSASHGWSLMEGRLAKVICRPAEMGMVQCDRMVNSTTIGA